MKVLIASLQVSTTASRGHLHPAIELALECKRRGHQPLLLPLPSLLGKEDSTVLRNAGVTVLDAPPLPPGVAKTGAELAHFASNSAETWRAYHSFLVAPLKYQYDGVVEILKIHKPDVVIYDLLAYAAPLAARALGIPDIGFCAGLKLLAPKEFQGPYIRAKEKLKPDLDRFLERIGVQTHFHYLELLSNCAQLVFTTEMLIGKSMAPIPDLVLAGPLPVSEDRNVEGAEVSIPHEDFAVLSFGSVFDPADLPEVTEAIIQATQSKNLKLLISSKKFSQVSETLPPHVKAYPYLPIPTLLLKARVFFHHGGANTFSEAFLTGCPQILIPISTDQPIQAHYLTESGAGFSLKPGDVTREKVDSLLARILDPADSIHSHIQKNKADFTKRNGAQVAVRLAESIVQNVELRRELEL